MAVSPFSESAPTNDLSCIRSIGVRFDPLRGEARAACISIPPLPDRFGLRILESESAPIPSSLLSWMQFPDLATENSVQFSRDANEIAIKLCRKILQNLNDDIDEVLVIGCHGMGLWQDTDSEQPAYVELCDSALLAEELGKTIVDHFPGRDLARGGCGGPVETHGMWMLLGDRSSHPGNHWRGLVEIAEQSTRFSLIPPIKEQVRGDATYSVDLCPGRRFLGELIARNQDISCDQTYSQLIDAGQPISKLVEDWNAATATANLGWLPQGVSSLPLFYTLDQSSFADAPLKEILASAMEYTAAKVIEHVRHCISPTTPVGELLIVSGSEMGVHVAETIQSRLPELPVRKLSGIGQDRTLAAASIGALAMMSVWQIPVAASRGSHVHRALGRITPGSPSNWRRVLYEMNSQAPWLLPLREAI